MNDEELRELLRALLPPDRPAPRDIWPAVVDRLEAPVSWSSLDAALVAFVAAVLLLFPEGVWLMAFHL